MTITHDPYVLPPGLPVPVDDGAAAHLLGSPIPDIVLQSSTGDIRLAERAANRLVLYVYPQTGPPEKPVVPGWDEVPGARGCTPQACGFRDLLTEFVALDAEVAGVSSQSLIEQLEFAARVNIPFAVIGDEEFVLANKLSLPTFEFDGAMFYKRLALVAEKGEIVKVFYPVFPPDGNGAAVLDWLTTHRGVPGDPVQCSARWPTAEAV
jgi:peroxiredoxin